MKPYTVTGDNNTEEDLRKNWRRGSKHYRRKKASRVYKKSFRQKDKGRLLVEIKELAIATFY